MAGCSSPPPAGLGLPITTEKPTKSQCETCRLTWAGFLQLPYRLCSPPPSVGQPRSCGVSPILKISLEDVLDRKHLPPLGLKDFEEYLLFVDERPEDLYFILWLREYTARYEEWSRTREKVPPRPSKSVHRVPFTAQSLPALAISYARAKQTFFIDGAEYQLEGPAEVLAPFRLAHDTEMARPGIYGSHPDPAVFTELATIVTRRLKLSLNDFLLAAYHNVGNIRAWCGVLAGLFILAATCLGPLISLFYHDSNRWERLVVLPGLFIGITLVISSMHGVCLMIYAFGDLRQLRKYELMRLIGISSGGGRPMELPKISLKPIYGVPPLSSQQTASTPSRKPSDPTIGQTHDRLQPPSSFSNARRGSLGPGPIQIPLRSSLVHSVSPLSESPATPAPPTGGSHPLPPPKIVVKHVRIESPTVSPLIFAHELVPSVKSVSSLGGVRAVEQLRSSSYGSESGSFSSSGGSYGFDEYGNPLQTPPPIEISGAYFDEIPDDDEGVAQGRPPSPVAMPVTTEMLKALTQQQGADEPDTHSASLHTPHALSSVDRWRTARFIRPFEDSDPSYDANGNPHSVSALDDFDFDGLPLRPHKQGAIIVNNAKDDLALPTPRPSFASESPRSFRKASYPAEEDLEAGPSAATPVPEPRRGPQAAMGWIQEHCRSAFSPMWHIPHLGTATLPVQAPQAEPERRMTTRAERWRNLFSVPGFKSPLTPIHSPIVNRAQWEIVVRSATASTLVTVCVAAILVGLPEFHHR